MAKNIDHELITETELQNIFGVVYEYAATEISSIERYKNSGCSLIATEIVETKIASYMNVYATPISREFNEIGLTDSYHMRSAFFLMVAFETAGVEWELSWFGNIANNFE